MSPNYLETMPSSLSTVTDVAFVESLHDLAAALDAWRKQAAAEEIDADDMADTGALVLERLKSAANAALTVAAMESVSQ